MVFVPRKSEVSEWVTVLASSVEYSATQIISGLL